MGSSSSQPLTSAHQQSPGTFPSSSFSPETQQIEKTEGQKVPELIAELEKQEEAEKPKAGQDAEEAEKSHLASLTERPIDGKVPGEASKEAEQKEAAQKTIVEYQQTEAEKSGLKLAYATFLNGPLHEDENDNNDNYFVSCRMLAYQLLHDPVTRTNSTNIKFVVVVTEAVTQSKRDRLTKDGAIIVEVASLKSSWIKPKAKRWKDQLTKLRMYEALTMFDRVLFVDSDTLLIRNIDAIFDDPAAKEQSNQKVAAETRDDEAPGPDTFVFAGNSGSGGLDHPYPPPKGKYFNGGFVLFKPSKALFDYYVSIANLKGRFDATYAEQSLLNYAHRREGNFPWKQVHYDWNINWPSIKDYDNGIATLHAKFWDDGNNDKGLRDLLLRCKWNMEGYWLGVESKWT